MYSSTYMYLVVGCSTREIFDYRTTKKEVIKYNCDTGAPIKQIYSETSIYFNDKVIALPQQADRTLMEEFLHKCNLYMYVKDDIIYDEIQQHYQYGNTEVSLEKMLSTKQSFKEEIQAKLNKLVNPKFYMISHDI